MRPQNEVADALNELGNKIENLQLNTWQLRTLRALNHCRTIALGGHVDACTDCGTLKVSYNSCRNRHCPKCQGHKKVEWIAARESELLPVPYFHVVFTIPRELNKLSMHKPRLVYDILFKTAWQTLHCFAKNKNVQTGMISILHTWGQNLSLHPHLHCIVPGGGVDFKTKQFKKLSSTGNFLFTVKGMSKMFRAKFVSELRMAGIKDQPLFDSLFKQNWVVFAKRPFANTSSVIEYLGRYTHKIAISNHRIKAIKNGQVNFTYKDYKTGGTNKIMSLTTNEFIRRFAQHILPKRFVRIRHYGILSSTWKRKKLKDLQRQLNVPIEKNKPAETKLGICYHCNKRSMKTLFTFDQRGPPAAFFIDKKNVSAKTNFSKMG